MPRITKVAYLYDTKGVPWSIDGIISGFSLLWGGAGIGKSFVAIGMGVSVATGNPWLGRKTHQGPVVYIVGEGGEMNVANRVRTAYKEWTIELSDPNAIDTPFYIVSPAVDMVEHSRDLVDLVGLYPEENPRLVVVDTLARCFSGDENKQEFMGKFVRNIDIIRDHYKCDVLVIHHANKEDDIRGSSALFGAADVSWRLTRTGRGQDKELLMTPDKLKERDSVGAQMKFTLEKRDLLGPGNRQVYNELGCKQQTLVVRPPKAALEDAKRLCEYANPIISARGKITYDEWRGNFSNISQSRFDNALSYIVTYPGKWGIMRGEKRATFVRARNGIEYTWPLLEEPSIEDVYL